MPGVAAAPEEEDEEAAADGDDDGATAAAAEPAVHPPPKGQDVDPHGFPVKESFTIELAALPARVRNVTLSVSNFGGSGMANVRRLAARVVDASAGGAVTAARDLFVTARPHAKGADGGRAVAPLLKLYREYTGAHTLTDTPSFSPCLLLPLSLLPSLSLSLSLCKSKCSVFIARLSCAE